MTLVLFSLMTTVCKKECVDLELGRKGKIQICFFFVFCFYDDWCQFRLCKSSQWYNSILFFFFPILLVSKVFMLNTIKHSSVGCHMHVLWHYTDSIRSYNSTNQIYNIMRCCSIQAWAGEDWLLIRDDNASGRFGSGFVESGPGLSSKI